MTKLESAAVTTLRLAALVTADDGLDLPEAERIIEARDRAVAKKVLRWCIYKASADQMDAADRNPAELDRLLANKD